MKLSIVLLLLLGIVSCHNAKPTVPRTMKMHTAAQSEDTPLTVPTVVVEAGETVYLNVHCNSPSLEQHCLKEPVKDTQGRAFTLEDKKQKNTTQEDIYALQGVTGEVTVVAVPNDTFHKIRIGWDYLIQVEARP